VAATCSPGRTNRGRYPECGKGPYGEAARASKYQRMKGRLIPVSRYGSVCPTGLPAEIPPPPAPQEGGRRQNSTFDVATFIAQLCQLHRDGKSYAAGDLVFEFFEKRIEQGEQELPTCDSVLTSLHAEQVSDTILVAILAATLPVRDRLPSRPDFLNRVHAHLAATGDLEEANTIAQAYK
jgi:hypothetical protein